MQRTECFSECKNGGEIFFVPVKLIALRSKLTEFSVEKRHTSSSVGVSLTDVFTSSLAVAPDMAESSVISTFA